MNLVIDGKNFCFRANVVNQLRNQRGEPVGVLYGFLRMLSKLLMDHEQINKVVVVWDGSKSKWRRTICPEYKSKHGNTISSGTRLLLDDLNTQIERLQEVFIPMLPVLQIKPERFEADDVINAVVRLEPGCFIASTDQDFYQLLEVATIIKPKGLYTIEDFRQEFGFEPCLWTQYRALVGDNSDNIPGVKRIGQVKAKKILQSGGVKEWIVQGEIEGNKEKQLLIDQLDRFLINVGLIDFELFPSRESLRGYVRSKLRKFRPDLDSTGLRSYLFRNDFRSVLKDFNAWVKPFERLL